MLLLEHARILPTQYRYSQNSQRILGRHIGKLSKGFFHYLKGTQDLWLTYGGTGEELAGLTDADGNMAEDCHATSEYAFIINSSAVS